MSSAGVARASIKRNGGEMVTVEDGGGLFAARATRRGRTFASMGETADRALLLLAQKIQTAAFGEMFA